MSLTIEEAIARVPQWVGASDLKVFPLPGGITNLNYRIETGGDTFVLRIAGENTALLGINREHEYAANRIAGQLHIAPKVLTIIRPEGYLVTHFIHGRTLPKEEISQPKNIARVAAALKKIHSMPAIPGVFSVFDTVESYALIARRYKTPLPANFDWLVERMNAARAAMYTSPLSPCPCHNDLLNENFLDDGQVRILDWEYAGMGDPFFDLGNFSTNHEFSDDQDLCLLDAYFGGLTEREWAHLNVMKILSDFREAMWGVVQIGISKLDFDFQGYADQHFRRLTENILNPLWGQWLKEISRNV